jgi:toxin FitB
VGFADVAIGAIAKYHKLTILTHNVKHYAPLELPVHDPLAGLPPD